MRSTQGQRQPRCDEELAPRRPRWKTASIGLLVSVSTFGLVVLAVEIGLSRAIGPPVYRRDAPFHPSLGFSGIPNSSTTRTDKRGSYVFKLNSLGFRGPEFPAPDEPVRDGRTRLLFLGDSFLRAWIVRENERMSEVVAATLNASGKQTEQFGLSVDGYGTAQELLLWRLYGRAIQPDLVVLVFFSGNDPSNNTFSLAGMTTGDDDYTRPYLVPNGEGGLDTRYIHPVRAFFRRHLRSFALLELRLIQRHKSGLAFGIDPSTEEQSTTTDRKNQMPHTSLNLFLPDPPDPRYQEAWRTTESLLIAFRDEVEAAGSQLLVVVVPDRSQVQYDARNVSYNSRLGGRLGALVDWNLPERRLHALFRREGMSAILPLEAMRDALRNGASDLYGEDHHLLAAGHAVIAERIAAWIADDSEPGTIDPDEFDPSEPVRILASLADHSGLMSFLDDDHLELVSVRDGRWLPNWFEMGAGWSVHKGIQLIVVDGAGDLVLRGFSPRQRGAYPFAIQATLGGERLSPKAIVEAPGPFEFRFRNPRPAVSAKFRRLALAVRFAPGKGTPKRLATFVLQEVGLLHE